MRKFYDITRSFSPRLPAWPGEPKSVVERLSGISGGGVPNVSRIDGCVYYGTHMDAPLHFIDDGSDIESMPVDVQIGTALVVHLPDAITADVLDLRAVEPGLYEMACLPIKIVGADGAPARVVLWGDE